MMWFRLPAAPPTLKPCLAGIGMITLSLSRLSGLRALQHRPLASVTLGPRVPQLTWCTWLPVKRLRPGGWPLRLQTYPMYDNSRRDRGGRGCSRGTNLNSKCIVNQCDFCLLFNHVLHIVYCTHTGEPALPKCHLIGARARSALQFIFLSAYFLLPYYICRKWPIFSFLTIMKTVLCLTLNISFDIWLFCLSIEFNEKKKKRWHFDIQILRLEEKKTWKKMI